MPSAIPSLEALLFPAHSFDAPSYEIGQLALAAVSALVGAVVWTFLEYVIHRWLGHHPATRPNPFAAEHVRHHSEGDYFAPTAKKVVVAALAFGALVGPALWVAGPLAGPAFLVGFFLMYGAYEVLHRREHTHPGIGAHMRRLRRHHFYHHFTDPSANHGVTTMFWDRVFGTYREPGVIRVPPKLAMHWLVDPGTGAVAAPFAAHYQLRSAA